MGAIRDVAWAQTAILVSPPTHTRAGGGPAMAQRAGADLHRVLQDCNLLEYEPLLLEEGEPLSLFPAPRHTHTATFVPSYMAIFAARLRTLRIASVVPRPHIYNTNTMMQSVYTSACEQPTVAFFKYFWLH